MESSKPPRRRVLNYTGFWLNVIWRITTHQTPETSSIYLIFNLNPPFLLKNWCPTWPAEVLSLSLVFPCLEQPLTSLQCILETRSTLQLLPCLSGTGFHSLVRHHYRIASSHSYIRPRKATVTRAKLGEVGLEEFLNDNVKPFVGYHVSSCPFSYRC